MSNNANNFTVVFQNDILVIPNLWLFCMGFSLSLFIKGKRSLFIGKAY